MWITCIRLLLLQQQHQSSTSKPSSSSSSDQIEHGGTLWKQVRQEIQNQIESIIGSTSSMSTMLLPPLEPSSTTSALRSNMDNNQTNIILLDDNLYFKSMRYTYFKLAKQYNSGFCQLYLHKDAYLSKANNQLRSLQIIQNSPITVSDAVIEKMDSILEEPSPSHRWESNTMVMPTINFINDSYKQLDIQRIWEEIYGLLNQHVGEDEVVVEQQQEKKIHDREATKSNAIHQLDLEMRRTINRLMTDNPTLRDKGKLLSAYKQSFLKQVFDIIDQEHGETFELETDIDQLINRFNNGCLDLLER
ncbi:hypothetical protein SAMD00019534_010610 [Acytostelium subglobosum LB1]|uniref:hypothetical protein n=1 Tax=Acytostelium subglobosum LB1 TaxID=1410327 RepID=UPI0006449362|nr:hypothetical protein SAMD00019534_010610 [Acytostelium subglobosum LB1]GAM17886.1 hypothetical protein SAMD00019534_010610 [Acytostelium subglobosum LB1]|eukprot:XP_012758482.1 hypothetical protein SAMD00019534_010610 [Acytostelium subglobosum LB1]